MRYDTPVYFQTVTPGAYDPETGDYGADTVREVVRYAAVIDTRAETMTLVYGTVRQGSLTVQLQAQYAAEPWMQSVAPVSGHVVIKVFDEGRKYRIYVLSACDERMQVQRVYGPYESRGFSNE